MTKAIRRTCRAERRTARAFLRDRARARLLAWTGRVTPINKPLCGPAARAMRDAARTVNHLSTVGTHLTTHRPADPMTEAARMTLALHTARSATAARPVLRALPFPAGLVTRGEYGHHVLAQIGGAR